MSTRRSFLSDLSWFQVAAGALAAMTSAWLASALGVGGTIIGAALGSLVVAISSSFYASTLDRGRTLIVQTDSGTRIERTTDDAPGDQDSPGALGETVRRVRWKVVALTTVVILAVSGAAMGAYEIITDKPYGSDSGNAKLGNPFGGGQRSSSDDPGSQQSSDPEDEQDQQDEEQPTEPTPSATEPTRPTTSVPTPSTTTPTPKPAPSASQDAEDR